MSSEIDAFASRLRDAIASSGLSITDFGEKSGVKYPSLRDYVSGKKKPGLDALASIVRTLDVDPLWLITGAVKDVDLHVNHFDGRAQNDIHVNLRGAVHIEAPEAAGAEEIGYRYSQYASHHQNDYKNSQLAKPASGVAESSEAGYSRRTARTSDQDGATTTLGDDYVLLPRHDVRASAGHGAVVHSEQIVDHMTFRTDWLRSKFGLRPQDVALIEVWGDSMEPTLSNGDLILVDISHPELRDNAVYVFQYNGTLLVKRIQRRMDGSVVIKSDNPRYEPDILPAGIAESLRIIGRMVWSGVRS